MEDYIPKYVPSHRPVYVYFDVYDLEEKRLRRANLEQTPEGTRHAG